MDKTQPAGVNKGHPREANSKLVDSLSPALQFDTLLATTATFNKNKTSSQCEQIIHGVCEVNKDLN